MIIAWVRGSCGAWRVVLVYITLQGETCVDSMGARHGQCRTVVEKLMWAWTKQTQHEIGCKKFVNYIWKLKDRSVTCTFTLYHLTPGTPCWLEPSGCSRLERVKLLQTVAAMQHAWHSQYLVLLESSFIQGLEILFKSKGPVGPLTSKSRGPHKKVRGI